MGEQMSLLQFVFAVISTVALAVSGWVRWALTRQGSKVDTMQESISGLTADVRVLEAKIEALPTAEMLAAQTEALRESISMHSQHVYQRLELREERLMHRIDDLAREFREHERSERLG